jgi:hypothetical protein
MSEAIFSCACIRERLMREAIIARAWSASGENPSAQSSRVHESERAIISHA